MFPRVITSTNHNMSRDIGVYFTSIEVLPKWYSVFRRPQLEREVATSLDRAQCVVDHIMFRVEVDGEEVVSWLYANACARATVNMMTIIDLRTLDVRKHMVKVSFVSAVDAVAFALIFPSE